MSRRRGSAAAAVTAAFVGPGTVTTCSLAGAEHGLTLLWALTLSLAVLLIAQTQSVRLGAAGRVSLAQGLMQEIRSPLLRALAALLVVGAIGVGCAAYQAGNLLGTAEGVRALAAVDGTTAFVASSIAAVLLLAFARRERLLQALTWLVFVMGIAFLVAASIARPSLSELFHGALVPRLPGGESGRGAFLLVAGLVGTTVVPYNLFLHSALVRDRTEGAADLPRERRDGLVFLPIGVAMSMWIVIAAAGAYHGLPDRPTRLHEFAGQLAGPLGRFGQAAFAVGVLSAGLTSALTAPMAAGLALSELAPRAPRALRLAASWGVMAAGVAAGALGGSPTRIIQGAQVLNGLLLPISLGFLVYVARSRRLLGDARSGPLALAGGLLALAVSIALAVATALKLWPAST